jgi:hypothetical protein
MLLTNKGNRIIIGGMPKSSYAFKPGQRIEGTMLTVVDSVDPNCWRMIRCMCDCGTEIVLPYSYVYAGKYSCGCRRRTRPDAIDHTGREITNRTSPEGHGRRLIVLWRDHETQQWIYTCSCCAQIFLLPRGMERGLFNSLQEIAGQTCPNYLEFVPLDRLERLLCPLGESRGISRQTLAEDWAPHFPSGRVKRDKHGVIEGFYGQPTSVPDWVIQKRKELAALNAPVPEDPEGFAEEFEPVEPTTE